MDWDSFFRNNSSAIIALGGVLIGSILTAITSVVVMGLQNKAALKAQQVNWSRARRQQQLDDVIEWLNQWLRAASRSRQLEDAIAEFKARRRRVDKSELQKMMDAANKQADLLRDMSPPIGPLVRSIGDEELTRLYDKFRELVARYKNALEEKDETRAMEANKLLLEEVEAVVALTQRRVDQLLGMMELS